MVHLLLLVALAQQHSDSSALRLLQDASNQLANAHSYHLQVLRRAEDSGKHHQSWEEQTLVAVVDGKRYRYEGMSDMGSAVAVSDGRTVTTYHVNEKLYKQTSSAQNASSTPIVADDESVLYEARHFNEELSRLVAGLQSASQLPEASLDIDGHVVRCQVIRFTQADAKTRTPDESFIDTFWINQQTGHIVRRRREDDSYIVLPGSDTHIPLHQVVTDTYTYFLNQREPDSTFASLLHQMQSWFLNSLRC
ncbi:MAG TPA: DUF2092 domain-containing protein [Terriglobales bacterium]|jgi:hypothetical protein